ncbi:MAG: polyprenyl synthetase family protein, partial [Verrucomicrobiota bacterium]
MNFFTRLANQHNMLTEREQSERPFEAIRPFLNQVDQEIRNQAECFDPSIRGYLEYLFDASGKHIRPALALCVGGAISGQPDERHVRLGVIVELIHMATLVHDDIMDGAKLRRAVPTACAKWGNSLSVLLGDSMFAHALSLSTEFNDTRFCRVISKASTELCTGEIIQTQRRFDLNLTKEEYFRIIEMKTGALFACSTELAARLSGGDAELCSRMGDYGMKLGTCYQIYDDCL